MNIQMLSVDNIKPYWRNPRRNDKTVTALIESIKKYGFNVPLVVDKENVIICGHTRYLAVRKLDWKTVPCVVSDMDEQKAKEYRIADNKIQELSEWDMDSLKLEMRDLPDIDVMAPYFGDLNVFKMLEESAGVDLKPVTQEQVDKARESFGNVSVEQGEKVEVICPDCDTMFYVNKE